MNRTKITACVVGVLTVLSVGIVAYAEAPSAKVLKHEILLAKKTLTARKVTGMVQNAKEMDSKVFEKIEEYNDAVKKYNSRNVVLREALEKEAEILAEIDALDSNHDLEYDDWEKKNKIAKQRLREAMTARIIASKELAPYTEQVKTIKAELDEIKGEADTLDTKIKNGFAEWSEAEQAVEDSFSTIETSAGH